MFCFSWEVWIAPAMTTDRNRYCKLRRFSRHRWTRVSPVCVPFLHAELKCCSCAQEECRNDAFLSASDLDWLSASRSRQWKYKKRPKSSWNCGWDWRKCSIVCRVVMRFFFFLSLLVVHGRGQSYSEQNKQLTLFCCIANGEQRERSAIVILQYVWAAWRDMWAGEGLHVLRLFPHFSAGNLCCN